VEELLFLYDPSISRKSSSRNLHNIKQSTYTISGTGTNLKVVAHVRREALR